MYIKGYGVDQKIYTKTKGYFDKAAENEKIGPASSLAMVLKEGANLILVGTQLEFHIHRTKEQMHEKVGPTYIIFAKTPFSRTIQILNANVGPTTMPILHANMGLTYL